MKFTEKFRVDPAPIKNQLLKLKKKLAELNRVRAITWGENVELLGKCYD